MVVNERHEPQVWLEGRLICTIPHYYKHGEAIGEYVKDLFTHDRKNKILPEILFEIG